MKKVFGTILSVVVGFVSWVIFVSICAVIFGAIYDTNPPDWTVLVNLTLPLLLAIVGGKLFYNEFTKESATTLLNKLKVLFINVKNSVISILPSRTANKKAVNVNNIPNSKKKQNQTAQYILSTVNYNIECANRSVMVSEFVDCYEKAIAGLARLVNFDKVSFNSSPAADYNKLREEYQLHLCDAIARAKDHTRKEIINKFRNSREFQQKAVIKFENDIDSVKNRFTQGTLELANKAKVELRKLVGMDIPDEIQEQLEPRIAVKKKYSGVAAELSGIDVMEGHNFEYWCANALRDCGFINVQVTPGSGDQGVDVLAEKDGIKYAVQCKRYNSDLGNTPVQEVHSGKTFYHCHVGAVMTNRSFTAGARKLAKETGTLLWDREWIVDYLNNKYSSAENAITN